jgi:hypothetical protein
MATTPPYRLGKDLTAITIQRLTVSSAGLFSNLGSPLNIQGVINDLGHEALAEMENIQPVTSTQINEVPISFGNAITITELKLANAAPALHTVKQSCSYVLVTWTEGDETFAGYFSVGPMTKSGVQGRGAQTVTVQFRPCNPGQAQVAYTAA